jgi:hypothetical protein
LLASNALPVEFKLAAQALDRPERRQLVLATARVIEPAVGPFDASVGEPLDPGASVEATGIRHVFSAGSSASGAPRSSK